MTIKSAQAGETPATDEKSGDEVVKTGGNGETPETPEMPETPEGNKVAEGETTKANPDGKPDEEAKEAEEEKPEPSAEEKLLEALRKERELRKAAERARDKTTRTETERIADMERELQQMRAERMRDTTLDKLAAELAGQGYEFNRSDVLELLEDVPLTEENAESAVTRRVEKLKRKAAVKTPDTATRAMTEGKSDVGLSNPYAGFKSR